MKRFIFILAAALVSSCSLNTDAPSEPTDPTTETFATSLQVDFSKMTKTPSGAYYRDFAVGSGPPISGQPVVIVSYQEYLKDGSLVGTVSTTTQAVSRMIVGIQEGMQGMMQNGERQIVIPSALGYGNSVTVPGVPPNSTLVVDIIFKGFSTQ